MQIDQPRAMLMHSCKIACLLQCNALLQFRIQWALFSSLFSFSVTVNGLLCGSEYLQVDLRNQQYKIAPKQIVWHPIPSHSGDNEPNKITTKGSDILNTVIHGFYWILAFAPSLWLRDNHPLNVISWGKLNIFPIVKIHKLCGTYPHFSSFFLHLTPIYSVWKV